MGLISLILLILALYFSLRLGRQISTPLLQLRVWLRAPDNPAPGAELQNELGDLARDLEAVSYTHLVGAMIVASIETVWAGLVTPPKRELKTFRYDEAARAPIRLERCV